MSEPTPAQEPAPISREEFIEAIAAQSGPESAEVFKQVLAKPEWADKQSFSSEDILEVIESLMAFARKVVIGPNSPVPLVDGQRQNMVGLIDNVQKNALPLLKAKHKK